MEDHPVAMAAVKRAPRTAKPSGYSGTPLVKKLGIKEGHVVRLVDAPRGYLKTLGDLPARVAFSKRAGARADIVHVFATKELEVERGLRANMRDIFPTGALWISWPKAASGLESELDDNVVRAMGLAAGLVDVKVCAVDATWSALKFVYRRKDR
ncbi:MAG: DUF3052 domain-containing protein [Thermoplasmatota archaeon]